MKPSVKSWKYVLLKLFLMKHQTLHQNHSFHLQQVLVQRKGLYRISKVQSSVMSVVIGVRLDQCIMLNLYLKNIN